MSERCAKNCQKWCECPLNPKPDPSFCIKNCALVNGQDFSNYEFNELRVNHQTRHLRKDKNV